MYVNFKYFLLLIVSCFCWKLYSLEPGWIITWDWHGSIRPPSFILNDLGSIEFQFNKETNRIDRAEINIEYFMAETILIPLQKPHTLYPTIRRSDGSDKFSKKVVLRGDFLRDFNCLLFLTIEKLEEEHRFKPGSSREEQAFEYLVQKEDKTTEIYIEFNRSSRFSSLKNEKSVVQDSNINSVKVYYNFWGSNSGCTEDFIDHYLGLDNFLQVN